MIDPKILDAVLPIPDLEELRDSMVKQLEEEGFVVTNFHSGGIFHTMLMIVLRVRIEFVELLRTVLNNMFLSHANGAWLDIKAVDFSKKRKQAQKTQGYVTISRTDAKGEAVRVAKGHVFKTEKDVNGDELRFFAMEDAVLQRGVLSTDILVEAELEGSRYNVPQGQITRSLIFLDGIDAITNQQNWISREGSDTETDESFRARGLRSWSELAQRAIHDTYVNVCEEVNGVLYVTVDDQHPRGQGTIDVVVTSEAGAASEALLEAVRAACETIRAPDDDVLVKSAEPVIQPISLTVTIPSALNQEGLAARVEAAIIDLLKIRQRRELHELTHADIIHKVKTEISDIRNVTVTMPEADLFLDKGKVILPGEITITVQGV